MNLFIYLGQRVTLRSPNIENRYTFRDHLRVPFRQKPCTLLWTILVMTPFYGLKVLRDKQT